jgi:hypothetical protein
VVIYRHNDVASAGPVVEIVDQTTSVRQIVDS